MDNKFKKYEEEPRLLLIDQNIDAVAWAKSFIATRDRNGFEIDEDIMIAWFANAIENAKDYVYNKGREYA